MKHQITLRRVRRLGALAALALCPALHAQGQPPPPRMTFDEDMAKAGIPFDEWLAEGEIEQIDWKVQILPARLGTDQRLRVTVLGTVNGRELNRNSESHDFHLLMRVRPPGGEWFPSYSMVRKEVPEPLPKRTDLEFSIQLYVTPGRYEMVLILYDTVTGMRSLARGPLIVEPLNKDPLPDAYRNMPGVEFLGENIGEHFSFSYTENGRLWLPAPSRRPVRLEILMNMSPSEVTPSLLDYRWLFPMFFSRSGAAQRYYSAAMLSVLKALADMRIENGSLQFTALDLTRREVMFQQNDVRQFDWPGLVEAVKKSTAPTISADALAGRRQNAAFFREALDQRLRSPAAADSGPAAQPSSQPPLRVFIIVSEPMLFTRGADLQRLAMPADCNCRIFYLRYLRGGAPFDELNRVMKPLKPERLDFAEPMELRRALRKILDEIGKL